MTDAGRDPRRAVSDAPSYPLVVTDAPSYPLVVTGAPSYPLVACSIASNNFLALAAVFAESYRRHHPGAEVYVAVADRRDPRVDYDRFPFRVLFADELGVPAFPSVAFRYDQLELATAIKPWLFTTLRDRFGHDRAAYFDPDILVADRLVEVERALAERPVALTPHITRPLDNVHRPSERLIRMTGVYNLGFAGLRLDESTRDFLAWWQERLARFCRIDPHHGLFVDQSWMDFAPAFLEDAAVLRSPRLNVAYWNLAHRALALEGDRVTVDGEPLGFVHFSGVDLGDLSALSRHQDRLDLVSLPAMRALLATYRGLAEAAGHARLRELPYGFARFSGGGPPIPRVLRRVLLRVDPHGRRFADPFDREAADSFWRWLAEPLDFPLGSLTRAALSLWEASPELVAAFPDVAHVDLPGVLAWLEENGSGGLPGELTAACALGARAVAEPVPYQQEPFRHFLRLAAPEDPDALAAVDLAAPGAWAAWLDEPFPGAPGLTRLAMLLWQRDAALQRAFPDPLGADLEPYAVWLVERGAERFGLAEASREALAARLPPGADRSRPREVEAAPAAPAESRAAAETAAPVAPVAGPRPFGVNVLGTFRRRDAAARAAQGTLAVLDEIGVPSSAVDLDHDVLGNSVDGLFAPPGGSPWPVLLTHFDLRLAPWRLGWLAAAATQGGRRIGYLDWEFERLPERYAERLAQWNEIWVPSAFARDVVTQAARVPVRVVPPCLPEVAAAATPRPWSPRPVLAARFAADDPLQRDDPWTLLEALARLAARRPDLDWRLRLRLEGLGDPTNPASEGAETLAALAAASAGLPVELDWAPLDEAARARLTADADLYVSLARTGGLRPELVDAARAGVAVVATRYGAPADWLDDDAGYPVAVALAPLGRSYGPVPGTTAWARATPEAVADALERALADPAARAARAATAHRRVDEIHGRVGAAARWLAELDRLRDALG